MKRGASVLTGLVALTLSSGCMWGIVRDANTGAPIPGASVHFIDSQYNVRFTTTDDNGFYIFVSDPERSQDGRTGPVAGPVDIAVGAPGFETLGDVRAVDFLDSALTEVQDFELRPDPQTYRNVAFGFSVRIPRGWKAFPGGGEQHAFFGCYGPEFVTGCGVTSDSLPRGMSLREWFELLRYGSKVTDREVEERSVTFGAQRGQEVIYTHADDPIDLAFLTERKGDAWALYCTVDPPDLSAAMPDILDIVQSFRFQR